MKNLLVEQKNIEFWIKGHLGGGGGWNKRDRVPHFLEVQWKSLLTKYVKWISRGVSQRAFAYANAGL